jgi:hypothetical protein
VLGESSDIVKRRCLKFERKRLANFVECSNAPCATELLTLATLDLSQLV